MEDTFLDYCSPQELEGEADAYICTVCGEGFQYYTRLIRHITIHESAEACPPEACPSEASNGLEAPVVFALQKNGTLTVVEKPEVSDSYGGLKSRQFDPQSTSVKGSSSEKGTKLCPCERCGQTFTNQLSLQHHQQYHSLGQHFKCTLCCKVHKDRDGLREHLQIHAHERFYSCGHCGQRFLKQETLSVHQKERHSSEARNYNRDAKSQETGQFYQCKLCDLHFFWLSDLQSHLLSHSLKQNGLTDNPKSITKENVPQRLKYADSQLRRCALCGKRFHKLKDLKQHHISCHLKEQEEDTNAETPKARQKNIQKTKGSRSFTTMQYHRLDNPKRKMRGRKRGSSKSSRLYPCKHCHRVFVHSSSLSRHNRYHKGTMHTCMYCGRHFPQRCDVTRHIALFHKSELAAADGKGEDEESTSVKEAKNSSGNAQDSSGTGTERSGIPKARLSFSCRECGKVFGLLSVYRRHVRYHRIEVNRALYKCPKCRCRFSQQSALDRHIKTHEDASSGVEKDGDAMADANKGDDVDSEDSDDTADECVNVKPALLYECTVCGESCTSMQTFLKHQAEHG